MKRSTPFLVLPALVFTLGLSACGGTAETDVVSEAPKEAASKPAYNPLAAEQQLIRDAEAVQGILDKDAERKKQAVLDAN